MEEKPPLDVPASLADELRTLCDQGHSVSAIKLLRIELGCGLKAAKDWIDADIERRWKK